MSATPQGKRRRWRPGPFTILALLGLAFIAVNWVFIIRPKLDHARRDRAELDAKNLGSALKHFHWKHGRYPRQDEGLQALMDAGSLERLPELPKDPWGHDYVYLLQDDSPVILSYGEDGEPGGDGLDADISHRLWPLPPRQ
ncbi:type II secretion system protein GspG [Pyxidicoccus sp. 3LG]